MKRLFSLAVLVVMSVSSGAGSAQNAEMPVPPSGVIGVTPEMLSPEYWITRTPDANRVLLTPLTSGRALGCWLRAVEQQTKDDMKRQILNTACSRISNYQLFSSRKVAFRQVRLKFPITPFQRRTVCSATRDFP